MTWQGIEATSSGMHARACICTCVKLPYLAFLEVWEPLEAVRPRAVSSQRCALHLGSKPGPHRHHVFPKGHAEGRARTCSHQPGSFSRPESHEIHVPFGRSSPTSPQG